MKQTIIILLLIANNLVLNAQDSISEKLVAHGAWFLFSSKTEEQFKDETLTKVDFFKKEDVSSIFFDNDDKIYSIFTNDGSEMLEDRWKMVDNNHFVMVSPIDQSTQIINIVEFDSKKLVLKNCSEIENGSKCITYTYFSTKEGWLPNSEIDELNTAGVIEIKK
ncbi:MAG: hypothetical protein RL662_654 [Bacteroidota bacterium]|jgi:hypothetical protein